MKHMMLDRDGNLFGDWDRTWQGVAKHGDPLLEATWNEVLPDSGPWRLAKAPPDFQRLINLVQTQLDPMVSRPPVSKLAHEQRDQITRVVEAAARLRTDKPG